MNKKFINRFKNIDTLTKSEIDSIEIASKSLKIILLSFISLSFIASLALSLWIIKISRELPNINILEKNSSQQSTQLYDINNNLISSVYADEDRVCVSLDKVSPYFKRAVLAIEDNRFYEHSGIDLTGTVRAFVNNAFGEAIQGGSTITQQLIKNSLLTPKRSVKRKVIEALLAIKAEKHYSKDDIIEKYMNIVYLGNHSYGIEKAARRYFNKAAIDLNLAESSFIAGLIRAPEYYSPFRNYKEAKARQKLVLNNMYYQGFITKEQMNKAYKTQLKIQSPEFKYHKYQYFIDHVLYTLRERYGDEVVRRGGLKVYTTLDPKVQDIALKTIKNGVKNLPRYTMVKEGALVTIDVKKGYISAIVGGVDYSSSQFNRATLTKRASGSSFKPVVYLTGLRLGLITPNSYVMDAPISYRTKWNVWRPRNWDGRYMGKMTVVQALTLSRNTPTVRIALKAGLDKVIETARLLGIRSHINRGYSVVLGSAGVSPLEMATIFTTLSREGVYLEPTAIRYIEDSNGSVIESDSRIPVSVFDKKYVRQLNSILINVVENGTGRQAKLAGREVAGKTGTTDDIRDIWFSGFTPDMVTTIWLGNDANLPLKGVFSSNCAKLWGDFAKAYYTEKIIPATPFVRVIKEETEEEPKEKQKEETVGQPVAPAPKKIIKPPPRTYTHQQEVQPKAQTIQKPVQNPNTVNPGQNNTYGNTTQRYGYNPNYYRPQTQRPNYYQRYPYNQRPVRPQTSPYNNYYNRQYRR